ncbi:MAG TPA: response regulator [Thermoanaerobaculia bacterium]|nr:response regulator [Thermoanaerobaculia bacterium]
MTSMLASQTARAARTPLILNVDDDEANLYAKGRMLRRAGFEVIDVTRGLEALELVAARNPDLVLLDVRLPDVNGLEICRRIKANPASAATIVLQISASFVEREDRLRGLDAGADSYMTEPVEPEELVANVRALLRLRQAEDEVRRAAAEWDATFAAARDGMALLDADGRIARCNRSFETLTHLPAGSSLREWLVAHGEPAMAGVFDAPSGSGDDSVELRLDERWVRIALDRVGARERRWVCSATDVTADYDVKLAHERITSILTSITEAHMVLDADWRVVEMNPAAEALLSVEASWLVGRNFWETYPAGLGARFHQEYETALQTGVPAHFEAHSNIVDKWFDVHAYPRADRLDIYYHDITERKELEQRLRSAKDAAEAASVAKDDFLATVSHELRTPMTAILGWAQMLQAHEAEPATVRVAADAIAQAAKAQAKLVDDMLEMSRIITGKMRIEPVACDLAAAVRDAADAVVPTIAVKSIDLTLDLDPVLVFGDPLRLQQVAWNLFSNAVKFTPTGGSIRASVRKEDGAAVLRVADSGSGIAADFLPSVFERFTQAETLLTRTGAGLGLGLSITKQIVDLHGGEISASSEGQGKGAVFTVRIPVLTESAFVPPTLASPAILSDARILVVDDAESTLRMLEALLTRSGAQVATVSSIAAARAALELGKFDIVVTDLAMAGESGVTLVEELTRRAVPDRPGIVVLTALGQHYRHVVEAFPIDAFLEKPFQPDTFTAKLAQIHADRRPSS